MTEELLKAEPSTVTFSVKVNRPREEADRGYEGKTVFESSLAVPLLPGQNPEPVVEAWLSLMQKSLAFIQVPTLVIKDGIIQERKK